jgi:hypothetical protein
MESAPAGPWTVVARQVKNCIIYLSTEMTHGMMQLFKFRQLVLAILKHTSERRTAKSLGELSSVMLAA